MNNVKCVYTDHHHRWFVGDYDKYECEYCNEAITMKFINSLGLDTHKVGPDLIELGATRDQAVQAIGDYLWELKRGPVQPLVASSAPMTHSCLSYSTEEIDRLQRGGHLAVAASEEKSVQGSQCPSCRQSLSEHLIGCHLASEEDVQRWLGLQKQCAQLLLEEQHRTELVSILRQAGWRGSWCDQQKIEGSAEWCPTQQLERLVGQYKLGFYTPQTAG